MKKLKKIIAGLILGSTLMAMPIYVSATEKIDSSSYQTHASNTNGISCTTYYRKYNNYLYAHKIVFSRTTSYGAVTMDNNDIWREKGAISLYSTTVKSGENVVKLQSYGKIKC